MHHVDQDNQHASDILNTLQEACYELDREARFVFVNRRGAELFGLPSADLLGRRLWDIYLVEPNSACYNTIQQLALEERREHQIEYISPLTGTWVMLSATPSDTGCVVVFRETEHTRQVREQYRSLVDNMPDVVTRWDKSLRLVFANPALETITGVPNSTLLGKTKREMEQPAAIARAWEALLKEVLTTGRLIDQHNEVKTPGRQVMMHTRLVPEKNAAGEVVSVMAITRDMSLLKSTQRELKAKNKLIGQMTLNAPAVITVHEASNGRVVYTNRPSDWPHRFFSKNANLLESANALLKQPIDQQRVDQFLRKKEQLADGETNESEFNLRDGRWVRMRCKVFSRGADGKPSKYISFITDVSSRHAAEEKIRDQARFIESVTSAIPEIIFVVEHPSRRISYFNHEPLLMTGPDVQDLGNMTADDLMQRLVIDADRKAVEEYCKRVPALTGNKTTAVEFRSERPPGKIRWFSLRGKVLQRDEQGLTVQMLHICQDITESKIATDQIEEQLHFIRLATVTLPDIITVVQIDNLNLTYASNAPLSRAVFHPNRQRPSRKAKNSEVIHDNYKAAVGGYFRSFYSCNDNDVQELEYQARYDDGPWQWFRMRGKVFKRDAAGKATHCVNSIQNISESKRAEQDLLDMKLQRQKEILSAVIEAQERERMRIGEDLHDGVAQLLYGIQARLQTIKETDAATRSIVNELMDISGEAIRDTRRLAFELVPGVLSDYGLETALKSFFHRMQTPRLSIRFSPLLGARSLAPELEITVYRIVQELVTNVIRHSGATECDVALRVSGPSLLLEVTDNGRGFNEKELNPNCRGIGLRNVKNRVALLEGHIDIRSGPNGTEIRIIVPV